MNSIYFLSVLQEGIVLSRGDKVWFYSWYNLREYDTLSDFLK